MAQVAQPAMRAGMQKQLPCAPAPHAVNASPGAPGVAAEDEHRPLLRAPEAPDVHRLLGGSEEDLRAHVAAGRD